MTFSRHILFDILTYWQVGSGLGEEASADSVVVRDESGLPFLPGRTVKGLLRNAMELAAVPADRIEKWFGSANAGIDDSETLETDVRLERSRFETKPGALCFASAQLSEEWRIWGRDLERRRSSGVEDDARFGLEIRGALFRYVASTSIDADGVARDKTLRVAEVAVPVRLRGRIDGPSDDSRWVEDLASAVPLLRTIGTRRHRGYGRTRCLLEDE
jgi:hypothetical protein